MASSSEFDEAIEKVLAYFGVSALKKEQRDVLDCLMERKDCMAILPTGFGKSLPYQMIIPLRKELQETAIGKIVVCTPLVALMQNQVERLNDIPDVVAAYKGKSQESDDKIKDGQVDIIFASPETLVGDSYWRDQLQQLKVDLIVVDEFHTIATWGGDENLVEQEAFRKWFRHVGELRALHPDASVLALSATCTKKIQKRVMKVLDFKKETTSIIMVSPNKSNVKVVVKKSDCDVSVAMYWLLEQIETLREDFLKLLIYGNSISDVSKIYTFLITELPDCRQYIEMFHSQTPDSKKSVILADFISVEKSKIRVLIATSALGMGVDISNCHCIILYGPPHNVVDFVQEIGRVGRDGQRSLAILLYNSNNLRCADNEVKDFIKTESCRRENLMNNFLYTSEELVDINTHQCCDICTKNCKCGACSKQDLEKYLDMDQSHDEDASDQEDSDSETEPYNPQDYLFSDDDNLYADLENFPNEN